MSAVAPDLMPGQLAVPESRLAAAAAAAAAASTGTAGTATITARTGTAAITLEVTH